MAKSARYPPLRYDLQRVPIDQYGAVSHIGPLSSSLFILFWSSFVFSVGGKLFSFNTSARELKSLNLSLSGPIPLYRKSGRRRGVFFSQSCSRNVFSFFPWFSCFLEILELTYK